MVSENSVTTSEMTLIRNDSLSISVPSIQFERNGNEYSASIVLPDGDPRTPWPDYQNQTVMITDLNDSDNDGVPDLSDIEMDPPVITVDPISIDLDLGSDPPNLLAGVTATDNVDGDITGSIVFSGDVNTNVLGSYEITYDVTDSSGNPAIQKTRTYRVLQVDNEPPVIIVNPISIDIEVGSDPPNLLAGVSATDNLDGNLTNSISISGSVNVNAVNVYLIQYNVSDAAGNSANQETRTYSVKDTTPPEIMVDPIEIGVEVGSPPPDILEGVKAFDLGSGDLTQLVVSFGTLNVNIPGSYTISYEVSDLFGNNAEKKTRNYIVADTTPPIIRVNPLEILVQLRAISPNLTEGISAFDNFNGDLTESLDITGTVDTSSLGDFTISYNVVDNSQNAALTQQRMYRVVETTSWEHNFEFFKGWNLVSFPGPPDQTNFLNSAIGLIWTLNGDDWVSVSPQDLTGQKGYWIYFGALVLATLSGIDFISTTRVRLGWNLIGVRQDVSNLSNRSSLNSTMWRWNGKKFVAENGELNPFLGNWVFAKSVDEL